MAAPEKKGIAALILASPRKGGDEDAATESAEADEDSSDGLDVVMEDFITAVKAGDAQGAADAFRDAHEICGAGYSNDKG